MSTCVSIPLEAFTAHALAVTNWIVTIITVLVSFNILDLNYLSKIE